MEELHKYIAAARQYGHTDDQIRSNLAAAGWHPAHVASAIGNSTSTPAPKPGRSRRIGGKKLIIFTAAAILVLAGAAGTAYKFRHTIATRLETPHAQPSITLYYDDGKTILWQDTNPAVEPTVQPANAPYFVDLVRTELRQKYGDNYWKQGAWQVTTSLSASLQATAEKLVADNYANIQNLTGGAADEEATVLQETQTGQIKALVGGTDRSNPDHGQINFATMPIEPGTSVFPFAYANLMEHTTDTGAGSVIADTQTPFPGYPCTNKNTAFAGGNCLWDYDLMYPGNLSVRYALGGARNVPAMQAIYAAAGTNNTVQAINQFTGLVRAMGASGGYNCYSDETLTKTAQCYGATVMGDGAYMSLTDETHALSTFANNGTAVPQTTIIAAKLNGKTKTTWQNPKGRQAIRPDTAYIINDIMSDPNASYLPGSCSVTCTASGFKFQRYNGWHFAVDDGHTNNNFSGSMASWSAKYTVVSWVGSHAQNVDLSAAKGTSSEFLVEPLTRGLMEAAHSGLTPSNWRQPSNVQTLPAFVVTNHIHYGDVEPSPASDLFPGWYKP